MAKEWWQKIDTNAHLTQVHERCESTIEEVDFIVKQCGCDANTKVIDIACGEGRHANELAKRGITVIGLDYTPELLRVAKADGSANFTQGNMLDLPFRSNSVDLALSMWNSIGYFSDEKENKKVLSEVSRVLNAGEYFVLQVNNPFNLITKLAERGYIDEFGRLREDTVESSEDGTIRKIALFDPITSRYQSRRTFLDTDDNQISYSVHDMRLYYPTELVNLFLENSLGIKSVYGSVREQRYSLESEELIIVARKT